MKVSVIIPIYNVEKFVARCAESLMRQTLRDVEFIFVNDGATDGSMVALTSVLDNFPARKNQIRILHHTQNMGLPAARNTGMKAAQGEYVFHCDSDDYVEPDMLEKMYETAMLFRCDIVWSDYYLTSAYSERYMKQPDFSTSQEALDGILDGVMKYNVWNKLIRRSLYARHNISFPYGYGMGEDLTIIKLFSHAKKVRHIPLPLYHYVRLNEHAFCNTYSQIHLQELKHNVDDVLAYVSAHYKGEVKDHLQYFKLEVKFPFLISDKREQYRLWREWFPEANGHAFKNRSMGIRRRLLQTMAAKGQWWFVWLYYTALYRSNLINCGVRKGRA